MLKYLFVFALFTFTSIYCQYILPSPSKDDFGKAFTDRSKVTLYGVGELSTSKFDLNNFSQSLNSPSGRLIMLATPSEYIRVFLSFNKGAGLTRVKGDSISFKESILFPETSTTGFFGSFSIPVFLKESKYELAPFFDVSYQKRNVDDNNKVKEFEAVNLCGGLTLTWYDYSVNRFRMLFSINYNYIEVIQGKNDFAEVFKIPNIPTIFKGIGFKIAVQLNDIAIYTDVKNANADKSINGITGWQVLIGTNFNASIISF